MTFILINLIKTKFSKYILFLHISGNYCIEYKDTGTIFEEIEFKVFEKLIKFDIPIIFIITKTPYDPNIISKNNKLEINRENERNIIINAIKDLIKYYFNNIKKKMNHKNQKKKFQIQKMMNKNLQINILKFFL